MGKFSQYRLKFRDEWKADPLFHKWIEHVDDDNLKAYCKFCRVFLPAHYAGLTDHAACSKHCKIAIHFENEAFNGSTSAMPPKHKMLSSQPFVCKSSMPRKEGLSSECDVQQSVEGICTLELTVEDETVQPCTENISMNFKNKNGKPNIQAPQRQRNNDREANEWTVGLLTSPDSKIFNQMQADPVQRRKSKYVSSDLSLQDQKLQDLRKRMKMLQSCDKGVTNFPGVSNLILGSNEGSYEDAVCLKQEMTEDIGEIGDDRVTNKLLEVRVDNCDDNGLKDIGSLISATDSTVWSSQEEPIHMNEFVSAKNKGGRTDSMLVKRYPQKYVMRWNSDPALKDWVAPVAGNVYRAKCQWCLVELRAHYKDLKHHAQSTKHTNSATAMRDVNATTNRDSSGKISQPDKDFFKSGLSRKFKRSSDAAEHKLKQSSCYFLSRSSWDRYKQKYRKAWEIDPNFCGWIAPVEGDVFRARCIYCHVLIRAHHRDLKEHSRTTKHAINITFGLPFNGNQASNWTGLATVLPKAKRPRQRSTVKQRLKPASCLTSNRHSAEVWQNDDLLRPDDTLTSVENLVSLATRPYNVPDESTVTTLVFPNASRLDESVAAVLPSNPKTQYRVKKLSSASAAVSAKSNVSDGVEEHDRMTRLMKRLSLWEILRMKVGRGGAAGDRLQIPRLLSEFEALHEQIKRITGKCLEPIVLGNADSIPSTDSVMVLSSEHLAELLGIAVGHYRIKDPPTDVEDGLGLDVLKKPTAENASISAVDLTLLPVVQSLENCAAAADYGGIHSAIFRANGLVEPSEEGITSDPHSLVFSPADHIIQLQDVACLTSGANGNSLLYSNADTAALLIQMNGASGHSQAPLFNAKDDDRRRAVDADKDLKTS